MAKPNWRNRIVGYEEVETSRLTANPKNWRLHPKNQQKALGAVLNKVGFVQSVVVNKNSGHIVDGHLRVELAKKAGETVPVVWVDLTDDEEKAMLAFLDPIAGLAETDLGTLSNLVNETQLDAELMEVMNLLHGQDVLPEGDVVELDRTVGDDDVIRFDEAPVFASSNRLGIPDLDPEMLADVTVDALWPDNQYEEDERQWFSIFRKVPNEANKGKVLAFYSEDVTFEGVWFEAHTYAKNFLLWGVKALVSPDFSVYPKDPYAVQVWAQYRKMWCSRYWQKVGFRVIPSLTVPMSVDNEDELELCFAGLPTGIPTVCVQAQGIGVQDDNTRRLWMRGMTAAYERLQWKRLIVYAGLEQGAWFTNNLPRQPELVLLPSIKNLQRSGRLKRDFKLTGRH